MRYTNHFLFFGKISDCHKCYNYLKRRYDYGNGDDTYELTYFNRKIEALIRLINKYSWFKVILNPVRHYNLLQLYIYAFDWRTEICLEQAREIVRKEIDAMNDGVFDANFKHCCKVYGIPVKENEDKHESS